VFNLEESKFEHEELLAGSGLTGVQPHHQSSRSLNLSCWQKQGGSQHWIIGYTISSAMAEANAWLRPVNLAWWSWKQRQGDGLGLNVIAILTGPPIVPKHQQEHLRVAQISQQWSHAFVLKPM